MVLPVIHTLRLEVRTAVGYRFVARYYFLIFFLIKIYLQLVNSLLLYTL